MKCSLMTWKKTDDGHDYVECSKDAPHRYLLKGLLLSIEANLCEAHVAWLRKNPEGWGTLEIVNLDTGRQLTSTREWNIG